MGVVGSGSCGRRSGGLPGIRSGGRGKRGAIAGGSMEGVVQRGGRCCCGSGLEGVVQRGSGCGWVGIQQRAGRGGRLRGAGNGGAGEGVAVQVFARDGGGAAAGR